MPAADKASRAVNLRGFHSQSTQPFKCKPRGMGAQGCYLGADFAAAEATRGSTTEAKKATVLITGLPDWLKGMGW